LSEAVERTLVLVKPDGVQRGLVGSIVARIEAKGYRLVGCKLLHMPRDLGERHYSEHRGKPFFDGLVAFITSAPLLAMVWEGPGVVAGVRHLMGATDPAAAVPGTVRGDWAVSIGLNLVHGSDSPERARTEVAIFFTPKELVSYSRDVEQWILG
jgi:nucleoside-diphosphate kinase